MDNDTIEISIYYYSYFYGTLNVSQTFNKVFL